MPLLSHENEPQIESSPPITGSCSTEDRVCLAGNEDGSVNMHISGQHSEYSQEECAEILRQAPLQIRSLYLRPTANPILADYCTEELVDLLLDVSCPGPLRTELEKYASMNETAATLFSPGVASKMVSIERKIQRAFRTFGGPFPSSIWDCCSWFCVTMMVTEDKHFLLFDGIVRIHEVAEKLHRHVENSGELDTRRRGIGGSSLSHSAPGRMERDFDSGMFSGTDHQRALHDLSEFVKAVLPFLYGVQDSPSGTLRTCRKLCSGSICCLLGVSRNYSYGRRASSVHSHATDEELSSLVDTSVVRLRQIRCPKNRRGIPEVSELITYDCGCDLPCFSCADTYPPSYIL